MCVSAHDVGEIDGAFFTTTFPHLFLMTYKDLVPERPVSTYVPRVFGFKIHKSSPCLPQPGNMMLIYAVYAWLTFMRFY